MRPLGPGYRLIAPIEGGGRRILVDFGYITEDERGRAKPPTGRPAVLTGALSLLLPPLL